LLVLALTVVMAARPGKFSLLQLLAISLVAGGGIGNLIDRVTNYGWVIDFMQLQAGLLGSGIFNVADVLIFAGLVVLLITTWMQQND
jgi:signal peptidase II